LDPTVRKAQTSDGRVYTLSDTVGFVRHLPHQLVEAFRSTLEEVADSDLIVHVVDGSHPDPESQLLAVRKVLAEIGADQVPEMVVINKVDATDPMTLARLSHAEPGAVAVSARTGQGIAELRASIEHALPHPAVEVELTVPYDRGDLVARVHAEGEIVATRHDEDGTHLRARVPAGLAAELRAAVRAEASSAQ